jgi:predicted restriction endonuclease
MSITIDTLFWVQIGSILTFVFTVFTLYKLLVSQKDATIELLKTRCESLSETKPDVLVERMGKRLVLLQAELEKAENEKTQDQKRITELNQKLALESQQFEGLSERIELAQKEVVRFRRTHPRAALANLYQNRCQVCGDSSGVPMEACSIQPISAGGPESLGNFLQLCPNHHRSFDSGKFSIGIDKHLVGIDADFELHPSHVLDLSAIRFHHKKTFKASEV